MNPTYPNQSSGAVENTATETGGVQAERLAELLIRMENRIDMLERALRDGQNEQIAIPPESRAEGADYVARKKVNMAAAVWKEDQEIRSGSVVCGFGFVHHPRVRLRPREDQVLISGFHCDCQKFIDGKFCGHCAALVEELQGGKRVMLLPGGAKYEGSEQINKQSGIKDIQIKDRTTNHRNQQVYRGKALCSFNFVHYPELTVDAAGEVVSAVCTCGNANGRQCVHCTALKSLVREREMTYAPVEILFQEELGPDVLQMPPEEPLELFEQEPVEVSAPEPAEIAAPDPEPELIGNGMTIRFGTDVQTKEPVMWLPNDTNQVTHINMGIIGTMGTGKTQFTKSVITQLYRQRRNNPGAEELGILIFDYKGDYNEEKTEFVEAAGAKVLKLHKLPFNPFALNDFKSKPQLHVHTAMSFADTLTRIYGLGPIQKTNLVQAILAAYEECGINADPRTWSRTAPTFAQVHAHYSKARGQRGDSLTAAMDTIAMFELFASDPMGTVSLYEMLRGTVVIDMSGYPSELKNLAVAIILDLFYAQMLNSSHSKLVTTADGGVYRQIKKVILVDEADNIMSSGLPVLKNIIKEGREFGVGMVLSTQYLDHFRGDDEDYRKYMKTWVVHNVENLKRSDVEYVFQLPISDPGAEQLYQRIKQLEKHHSIVRIGTDVPTYMEDLPFFRIAQESRESYLQTEEAEPEATDEEA